MNSIRTLNLLALFVLILALAACSEDGVVEVCKKCPPAEQPLPFPNTKAQLLANFVTVYESMDYNEFRNLISHDFQLILQQGTIDDFPQVGPTLDYDEEMAIHARMFAGKEVENSAGNLVPAVTSVWFNEFRQLTDWIRSPPNGEIPDSERGIYQVDIIVNHDEDGAPFSIQGQLVFYVVARDSIVEGSSTEYYQMVGQKDETLDQKRASTHKAFGSWLARFE